MVDIGIEFDGLGSVALCSHEVVEIEFGDSPQLPGFIQIGTRRDYPVEVLDGQHIVLIL